MLPAACFSPLMLAAHVWTEGRVAILALLFCPIIAVDCFSRLAVPASSLDISAGSEAQEDYCVTGTPSAEDEGKTA